MINNLGAKAADAAIAYVTQLPAGPMKSRGLQALLVTLAQKDPTKAVGLLDQISPGEPLSQALTFIGASWAMTDKKAALDWANQQADPQVKSQILAGVTQGMAQKAMDLNEPNRALEILQSLPAGDSRENGIQSVLFQLSQNDSKGAVGYAMKLPSSENRDNMISSLADRWMRNDPQGALDWYGALTDPKLKERVSGNMIGILYSNDQKAAINMLNSLPEGISKDDAAVNISMSMVKIDPQSAIGLVSGIANAYRRSSAQKRIVSTWMRNDPSAATQWVNSSSLPQDVKELVLEQK
ncbi:MAG: hypothetical protein WAN16_01190 [Chthoniobacterales bacterium]